MCFLYDMTYMLAKRSSLVGVSVYVWSVWLVAAALVAQYFKFGWNQTDAHHHHHQPSFSHLGIYPRLDCRSDQIQIGRRIAWENIAINIQWSWLILAEDHTGFERVGSRTLACGGRCLSCVCKVLGTVGVGKIIVTYMMVLIGKAWYFTARDLLSRKEREK